MALTILEITVKVTLKSGDEYTISIGNTTSIASGRYIQVSGDNAVYLSESGYEKTFDTSTAYFAELVIVRALEESSTYSKYFSSGDLIGFDSISFPAQRIRSRSSSHILLTIPF